MLMAIFGESCTGKSTFAEMLKEKLDAQVYAGKDYLRLAKSENAARELFAEKLKEAVTGAHTIYVIAEKEHLALLPEGAVRVLMTADLPLILERFAQRMHGILPPPVSAMLQKKHGIFDGETYDYHIHNSENAEEVCRKIVGQERVHDISETL